MDRTETAGAVRREFDRVLECRGSRPARAWEPWESDGRGQSRRLEESVRAAPHASAVGPDAAEAAAEPPAGQKRVPPGAQSPAGAPPWEAPGEAARHAPLLEDEWAVPRAEGESELKAWWAE